MVGIFYFPTFSVMLGTFGFQTSASEIALWPVSSTTRSELEFFVLRRATMEACDVFVLVLFLLQQYIVRPIKTSSNVPPTA